MVTIFLNCNDIEQILKDYVQEEYETDIEEFHWDTYNNPSGIHLKFKGDKNR